MEASQLLPSSLPMDETDQLKRKRPRILYALGWFGTLCLTLGSTIIISLLAFILFLWTADASNVVWQHIIIAAWLTRSVTLSSLLIRVVAGALATLSTSMLAALSLQHYYILLPDSAAATLIQFQNSGPLSLAVLLSRSLHAGRSSSIALLVFVLWMSTLILQFSSTILLFDVGNGLIPGFQQHRVLPFGLDGSSEYGLLEQYLSVDSMGYWITSPAAYPAFAEYTEPPEILDGVHDTGLSMRAFLPFPLKQQRNLLNSYEGMATVIDSRVVCMRPSFKDVVISLVEQPYPKEGGGIYFAPPGGAPLFTGVVGTDLAAPRFQAMAPDNNAGNVEIVVAPVGTQPTTANSTDPLQRFNCSSAYSGPHGTDEWPLVFCQVAQTRGIISAMQKIPDAEDTNLNDYLNGDPGAAFLVFNMSGSYESWLCYCNKANPEVNGGYCEHGPAKGNLSFLGPQSYERNGEWLRIPSNDPEIYLSASICYTAFNAANREVQVSSSVNTSEPVIGWNPKDIKFTTEAIQNQLGTLHDNATLSSRGVLSLWPLASWLSQPDDPYNTPAPIDLARGEGVTLFACRDCMSPDEYSSGSVTFVNSEISAIFGDIVRNTGHPALALQGIFTILYGNMYYALTQQFDVSKNATIVEFVDCAQPVAWRGFTVLAVAVAAHLLGVAVTLYLFARNGYPGVVGSAWPVLAQLRGKEIEEWIDQTGASRDSEIVEAMQRTGTAKHWVGLTGSHRRLGREGAKEPDG